MNLKKLKSLLASEGCDKIYVKRLSPNDNSKNQVYLGGSLEVLNILPIGEIISEDAGGWERERFKATLNFHWLIEDGNLCKAPGAQLILYPKYPEVRLSGFLKGCSDAPSELMAKRLEGRLLFLSVTEKGEVIAYVVSQDSELANEFNRLSLDTFSVFSIIPLPKSVNSKEQLLKELKRIHKTGWIVSKRIDKNRNILPCLSPNCGGYTLEAELGITPNGYSEPDYLGWEVKQFGVNNFKLVGSSVITLMTPEPTSGYYVDKGVEAFIRKYGYADLKGRADRLNFGGIHKSGIVHARTGLTLALIGFDIASKKIRNTNGKIALLDKKGNEAASWSFSSMLKHWNRKHHQACYVPSKSELLPERRYQYGDKVIMGSGTDFQLFLNEMAEGHIYYDPGIKVENITTKPLVKRRSQFRIVSKNLGNLYKINEVVNVLE